MLKYSAWIFNINVAQESFKFWRYFRGIFFLAFLSNFTKELKCLLVDPPIVGFIYISYQNIITADRLGIFNL